MARRLRFDPRALDELREGARRLEARAGLGDAFVDAVEATVARIGEAPETFRPLLTTRTGLVVRGATVRRFKLHVVFVETADAVEILALAHARRRPFYWRRRLPPAGT